MVGGGGGMKKMFLLKQIMVAWALPCDLRLYLIALLDELKAWIGYVSYSYRGGGYYVTDVLYLCYAADMAIAEARLFLSMLWRIAVKGIYMDCILLRGTQRGNNEFVRAIEPIMADRMSNATVVAPPCHLFCIAQATLRFKEYCFAHASSLEGDRKRIHRDAVTTSLCTLFNAYGSDASLKPCVMVVHDASLLQTSDRESLVKSLREVVGRYHGNKRFFILWLEETWLPQSLLPAMPSMVLQPGRSV
jgi:hypothetical protein